MYQLTRVHANISKVFLARHTSPPGYSRKTLTDLHLSLLPRKLDLRVKVKHLNYYWRISGTWMLVRTLRDGGFRRSWMVLGECCISVLILFLSALTRFFLSFLGSTLFWLSWFTNGRCHHILVPFDTCRTYYDGTKMISRLGNPFAPPEWFLESKCSIHLLPRYQNVERSEIALYLHPN